MTELRFDAVTVRYGRGRRAINAVDQVSLTVPSGTVMGLVGESGSGKSTLARASVGLAPLASGRVLLDGSELHATAGRPKPPPVQMVFQDPYASLDPRMTIGATVYEAMPKLRGHGRASRQAEVARLLELVKLDPDRAGVLPGRLSGGQRQRVALARALAARPGVLVADEITSALDVSVQGTVLNLVRDLQTELGLTMLFISHNLAVIRYVSDFIAVMHLGRIVEDGPADQVLDDPQHPYTRELLESAPRRGGHHLLLEGSARNHPQLAAADLPDPHHPPEGCRFHSRCPVGPLVFESRSACRTEDPQIGAGDRLHHAACHFAGAPVASTSEEAAPNVSG